VRTAELEQRVGDLVVPAGGDDGQAQPARVDGTACGAPLPLTGESVDGAGLASVASSSNAARPGQVVAHAVALGLQVAQVLLGRVHGSACRPDDLEAVALEAGALVGLL
jgi:hypothetical protein